MLPKSWFWLPRSVQSVWSTTQGSGHGTFLKSRASTTKSSTSTGMRDKRVLEMPRTRQRHFVCVCVCVCV
ncbi:unnamed protein product [Symbiodinium sp. CCMP2592]|nr:unnamed protein product [Symbiodinium sp. CCMP2592]